MGQKIKTGDQVKVLAGRDRGRMGTVLRMVSDDYVLVEGINIVKKHTRGNPQAGTQGGIIEREAKIHRSNLSLLHPVTNKAGRIGFKTLENGRKVRVFKSDGEVLEE